MHLKKLMLKRFTYSVFTFLMIGIVVISSSYALFSKTVMNQTDQVMTIGALSITYEDNSSTIVNTQIEPMSDETAATKMDNIYTFIVTNTGSVAYKYTVSLQNDPNYSTNILNHNYIRYNLNAEGVNVLGTKTNGLINEGTINPGSEKTFNLRLWVTDDALPNSAIGAEIHLNVVVDGEAGKSSQALSSVIKSANPVQTPLTVPGQNTSLSNEALLASTPDDYGTSYYFRGAVENNYVVFANMCWRAVRVDGANNTKLVLYNYNPNNAQNPCDASQDGTSNAFARFSDINYMTSFNSSFDDNTYLGFMYGTAGASTYLAAHTNTNKSTILANLESWYTNVLSVQNGFDANKLADTIWCNDKSFVTDTSFDPYEVSPTTSALGYGTNATYYSALARVFPSETATPSLVCPTDSSGSSTYKLSKFTVSDSTNGNGKLSYKIGLLTADEVEFAGESFSSAASNYYLNKNATSDWWWTMTPLLFIEDYGPSMASVLESGYIGELSLNIAGALRPAISLTSNVNVAGEGTSSNPYIVQ